jgi:putative transposase
MPMPPGRLRRGNHNVHQLYVHFVFVTKYRQKTLHEKKEGIYFDIFEGICRDKLHECQLLSMGTDGDHVHLLVRYPPVLAISDIVKALKGGFSHKWNTDHAEKGAYGKTQKFYWSAGYFVKSVGQSTMGVAAGYIDKQGNAKSQKAQ